MNTDNSMNGPKDTLKIFLKEDIEDIRTRLASLKGKLKAEDFNTLEAELNERSETLDSLKDEDKTHLFILRREIGQLRESIESLAVKQGWWSTLPYYARVVLIILPVVLYLAVLSLIQILNKGDIYNYPATQTAQVAQTVLASQMTATAQAAVSSPLVTPVATQTP
jgi:hypothetical protein